MRNLAPDIRRQRLMIEGFYDIDVTEETIREFFKTITDGLSLRMYGEPIIFSPGGEGKEENQGYDAFVPLIDSGISLYVWSASKFFSCIIYTCKDFDETAALRISKDFFQIADTEFMSF